MCDTEYNLDRSVDGYGSSKYYSPSQREKTSKQKDCEAAEVVHKQCRERNAAVASVVIYFRPNQLIPLKTFTDKS